MSDERDHDEDRLAPARGVAVAVVASVALALLAVLLWIAARLLWRAG